MYSRLNTLVNEINALGLNQVDDWEINRKIAKHVHELYELGYKTLIKGSAVGIEKMAKKKNKSRAQALSAIHKPKKSGESSSHKKNSKSSTTHRPRRLSPPPMCLMALERCK